ncbi:MAG: hypothetical protein R3256_07325 [Thalassovita sp.]|nr:hypothetical protein [Thalassovita sp.]
MVNFLVSFLVWAISPLSVNGINLIYPLFSLKVIALLWFNGYPQNRSFFSLLFFLFACADVFVFYLFGSFSIYSLAFSYLL